VQATAHHAAAAGRGLLARHTGVFCGRGVATQATQEAVDRIGHGESEIAGAGGDGGAYRRGGWGSAFAAEFGRVVVVVVVVWRGVRVVDVF
jgi:hypothetical protein